MAIPFTGANFFVQSVTQLGATGIRVRYSHDPLAASVNGANDALNINNYSISGPAQNLVKHAAIVPDDPQSIDLTVSAPLALGTWTVTVSAAVQTATADPLQVPRADEFEVTFLASGEDLNGGAKNDSAEATIRKHLPPSLAGRAWNALIAALAVGDRLNWDNAVLAFDQLFKSTASGLYLVRKASDDGLNKPPDIGMPDDLFRKLAIKTSAAKLTHEVLLEIMEIFYGSDAVRASSSTELEEPFVLADGDTLELLLDGRDAVTVFFRESDFTRITQAEADEVAAAITRGLRQNRNKAFAISFRDPVTDGWKVRIYSGSLGLGSSVQVTGGRAQLGLNFPQKLTTYNAVVSSGDAYNWAVSSPEAGVNRVKLVNAGGTSKVDLTTVQAGDFVIFEAANSDIPEAVYKILDVGVSFSGSALEQYFDIATDIADHTFLQLSNQELTFFRPTRRTIHQAGSRTVVIAQTIADQLDVQIPATTQAVGRTIKTASYPHDSAILTVDTMQRLGTTVTVNTDGPHGLVVGDQLLVEAAAPDNSAPARTAGAPGTSGNPGTSDASLATIWSQLRTQDVLGTREHLALTLDDGRVLITGGFNTVAAVDTVIDDCQLFRISATTELSPDVEQYTYHWDAAADLPAVRCRHGGSVLDDSRVLVSGGFSSGGAFLETIALYTPDGGAGAWAAGNSMVAKRMKHGQTTLANGKVLVTGGASNDVTAIGSCELWDPATGNWSAAASMANVRADHQQVLLADGRVLVVGGRFLARAHPDDDRVLAHWKIDEAGGSTLADVGGTYNLTASGGPTIVAGKIGNARDFSVASSYANGAGNGAAVTALLGNWTISAWVYGGSGVIASYSGSGETQANNILAQVERIGNTVRVTWERSTGTDVQVTTGTLAFTSHWNHVAVVKKLNGSTYDVQVFLNGALAQTFTGLLNADGGSTSSWWLGRNGEASTTFGGLIDDVCVSKYARAEGEIRDIYRRGVGAVGVNASVVPALTGEVHSGCEIYTPGTNTWARTGNLAQGRIGHSLTLLSDGRVLAVGGTGESGALNTAEIWNPTTGRWSPAGRMTTSRSGHGAVYLASRNQVLVAGGGVQAPEYFQVQTLRWRPVPNAPTNTEALLSQSLTAIGTGALLHGGFRANGSTVPAYLYQAGEDTQANGGLNGLFSVESVIDSDSFTYSTPDFPGLTTNGNSEVTIRALKALDGGSIPGPFVLDPLEGAAVTGTETEATIDLYAGSQYGVLEVADALEFPDEPGWLIIGFGGDAAVAPVKYLGRQSSTGLILDYSFRFPATNLASGFTVSSATRASNVTTLTLNLPAGTTDHGLVIGQTLYFKSTVASFSFGYRTITSRSATTISFTDVGSDITTASPGSVIVHGPKVTLLKQKGLFVPAHPEQVGAAYITSSASGRVAALQTLENSVAAGETVDVTIIYPGDRGLGGEGLPVTGQRLSDKITVWGGDNLQEILSTARGEE